MADQTKTLQLLVDVGVPMSIGAILKGLDIYHPRQRRQLLQALGRLMEKKHVARADAKDFTAARVAQLKGQEPHYVATKAGRALIAGGKRITSGPRGPHAAPRKALANTQRQKLWSAFRISKKATRAALAEAVGGEADAAMENARAFLKALLRAGVAVEMRAREKGFAPTSNGFKRFALVRDLGPLAPSARQAGLFDPNNGETIPYAEKSR